MKKSGFYSTGQFAALADVSVRTIRFYDQKGLLPPSYVSESGARFYTDEDLAALQQILLLKYLGFSLDDIRSMTVQGADRTHLLSSLHIQAKLVQDRIEQLQSVMEAIHETEAELQSPKAADWQKMLRLIHLTGMEHSLANQYRTASNLSARVALHSLYSTNPQGWFPWIFLKLNLAPSMSVLDEGCGDGSLWTQNMARLPEGVRILLSDRSEGMVRDARRNIAAARQAALSTGEGEPKREAADWQFRVFDCSAIPCPAASFDLVTANHVLFYVDDLSAALLQVRRVLKPEGRFVCSTYGSRHMHEITDLVREFDSHIVLSGDRLYESFGLENGESLLRQVFDHVRLERYEDALEVTEAQPLIEYILSCHGNQNQYIVPRYKEFRAFVEAKTRKGFHVTKDAGIFICQ